MRINKQPGGSVDERRLFGGGFQRRRTNFRHHHSSKEVNQTTETTTRLISQNKKRKLQIQSKWTQTRNLFLPLRNTHGVAITFLRRRNLVDEFGSVSIRRFLMAGDEESCRREPLYRPSEQSRRVEWESQALTWQSWLLSFVKILFIYCFLFSGGRTTD